MPSFALVSLLAVAAISAKAQPAETNSIREALLRQIPDCRVIAANAVRVLAGSTNDVEAVVTEWGALCRDSEEFRLYSLSAQLNTLNEKSPELDLQQWGLLKKVGKRRNNSPLFPQLAELMQKNAAAAKPMSEDGKLLQHWFQNGGYAKDYPDAPYAHSRLYDFYRADIESAVRGGFMTMAGTMGAWIPSGDLSRLGAHPSFGFDLNAGWNRFSVGLLFDFRFAGTSDSYTFFNPNSGVLEKSNVFLNFLIGSDFRWEAVRANRISLFAVAGLGYEIFTHYATSRYSRQRPAYSESFNLNAGLAGRVYFSDERTAFVEMNIRVHQAHFSDGGLGGDTFSGIYLTAVASAGYRLAFD
jgi:hypothetical protein